MFRLSLLILTILCSSLDLGKSLNYNIARRHVKLAVPKSRVFSVSELATTVPYEHKEVPKTSELIRFALPTLGIWLLQPILSLIDTSVVGISKSATIAQLAALGPGIAWIDSTSYIFQFMGIATTNLFANALSEKNEKKCEKVLSHSTFTALLFGIILFLIQFGFAGQAITTLSGTATDSISYGITYSRIRALAAPFALPTIVAQAAFLAAKDAVTPLKAVLVGAVVNLVGDLLLVTFGNMGLTGAAIATALSQVAGAVFLFYKVFQQVAEKNKKEKNNYPGKGVKSTWATLKEKVSFPNVSEIKSFLSFCGPLFAVLLVKMFLWTYTTYACSAAGAIDLAAHQISINLFLFFCIFGDVVSQLPQTFLPYYLKSAVKPSSEEPSLGEPQDEMANDTGKVKVASFPALNSVHEIVKKVLLISGTIGLSNGLFYQIINRYGYTLFTNSAEIMSRMTAAAGLLSLAVIPHCMALGIEGILIAFRDFKFHSSLYFLFGAVFVVYQSIVRMNKWGIVGVWAGTALYQWTRIFILLFRVKHILKKSKTELQQEGTGPMENK